MSEDVETARSGLELSWQPEALSSQVLARPLGIAHGDRQVHLEFKRITRHFFKERYSSCQLR